MGFLSGKVALVTGGSRGIGFAIAKALHAEDAIVFLTSRDAAAAAEAARAIGPRAHGLGCDVRSHHAVRDAFAELDRKAGGLDVLVNNAGVGVFKPVTEMTPEEWSTVIETNLNGPFYCCREAVPLMKKRGGGYVINISSLAGKNPFVNGAAYNASKFGLNGFSEAFMMEIRYEGIRVSYVMPGSVNTEFGRGSAQGKDWALTAGDVAETVLDLLRSPSRALMSRVEMRPSQPPKK